MTVLRALSFIESFIELPNTFLRPRPTDTFLKSLNMKNFVKVMKKAVKSVKFIIKILSEES